MKKLLILSLLLMLPMSIRADSPKYDQGIIDTLSGRATHYTAGYIIIYDSKTANSPAIIISGPAGTVDGRDVSADGTTLDSIGVSTGSIQTTLDSIATSTGTLEAQVDVLEASTATLAGQVAVLETSTGTLESNVNALIISTGLLVNKSGDTMTGTLNGTDVDLTYGISASTAVIGDVDITYGISASTMTVHRIEATKGKTLNIVGYSSNTVSGSLNIIAGTASGTNANAGHLNLYGGNAVATDADGGDVIISGGAGGTNTGTGGNVKIYGGDATYYGGDIWFYAGDSTGGTQNDGDIYFNVNNVTFGRMRGEHSDASDTQRFILGGDMARQGSKKLDVSGGINTDDINAAYGVYASTAVITDITADDISSTYGISASTGVFTSSVTIGAYTLPTNDGSASEILQTNGSGVLSWTSAGAGDVVLASTQTFTGQNTFNQGVIVASNTKVNPINGQISYNPDDAKMWAYTDNSWTQIDGGGGGAGDNLGNHVATTTLNMNSFEISNCAGLNIQNTKYLKYAGVNFLKGTNEGVLIGEGINATPTYAVYIGKNVCGSATTASGLYNTVVGFWAGYSLTTGDQNSFYGRDTGLDITDGTNNALFGYRAGRGYNRTGCVLLGSNVANNILAGSNFLAIDNSDTTTPLIYGNFTDNYVIIYSTLCIDTTNRYGALTVKGDVVPDGTTHDLGTSANYWNTLHISSIVYHSLNDIDKTTAVNLIKNMKLSDKTTHDIAYIPERKYFETKKVFISTDTALEIEFKNKVKYEKTDTDKDNPYYDYTYEVTEKAGTNFNILLEALITTVKELQLKVNALEAVGKLK